MSTLLLWFHPEHEKSRTGRALADAAAALDGVTLVNMAALYPDIRTLDVGVEVARLLAADRLILQFPIHWYLPPPLLLAWQNSVLTRMFYIKPEEEGARIKGMPLLVAATAGNTPEAYSPEGVNLFPLADLLKPLHSTAHRCALAWSDPFLVYRANRLDEAQRAAAAADYAVRIEDWRAA
ncbi:NAD(P)H-dependent oxidoreductase [Sphingomonas sp.]|uniref:NAD(P)H-dependent oxidoreductase n=1 Tax=Sphingomonas sp. TaxID=28214 RepID=UPI000DB7A239|nr:NAD(P)H-dependent oxidoreductase [Sphingomonas sp.]PZU10148.1 MAG: NAD(P)H dehydrogenase [Sphingomonas sp.]